MTWKIMNEVVTVIITEYLLYEISLLLNLSFLLYDIIFLLWTWPALLFFTPVGEQWMNQWDLPALTSINLEFFSSLSGFHRGTSVFSYYEYMGITASLVQCLNQMEIWFVVRCQRVVMWAEKPASLLSLLHLNSKDPEQFDWSVWVRCLQGNFVQVWIN